MYRQFFVYHTQLILREHHHILWYLLAYGNDLISGGSDLLSGGNELISGEYDLISGWNELMGGENKLASGLLCEQVVGTSKKVAGTSK